MKPIRNMLALLAIVLAGLTTTQAQDPLSSWNDGPAKQSIMNFVAKVTKEGSADFVPVSERIATFDNGGTLWCEQPVPVQMFFALDRVKALAPQHPEWKTKEPFASLLKLEQQVIDAVTPFAVTTGTSAAFVTTPEDPNILPALIAYVSEFVPKHSGENYHPHVTTGLAPREYLDKMPTEPFEAFTFSPGGAAVYHLGHFGTAAKELKEWDLKP